MIYKFHRQTPALCIYNGQDTANIVCESKKILKKVEDGSGLSIPDFCFIALVLFHSSQKFFLSVPHMMDTFSYLSFEDQADKET